MTAETSKIKSKLAALSASFDDLEAHLEPLFSQPFPETIIALEPLQQAKLQTLIPYLVYDLIFSSVSNNTVQVLTILTILNATVYLKTRGIDPKTHPVIPELVSNFLYVWRVSFLEINCLVKPYRIEFENILKR
jgi:exosome complex protein LRP1